MTDHQLQEQLLNAELTAPQGVWEQVLTVLDEDAEDAELEKKINNSLLAVSATAWNNIEETLNTIKEDEAIAASVNDTELTPPVFIWEKIEYSLNETDDTAIADKLIKAEVQAPADMWPKIEEQLQAAAKVIPITKRYAPLYRMAAAAVILGLIAWGAFQLIPKQQATTASNEPKAIPKENTPPPTDTNTAVQKPSVVVNEPEQTESKRNDLIAPVHKRRTIAKTISPDELAHNSARPAAKSSDFAETNYLLVLDEKGELIRVSKKLSAMDCAKNNDVPVDAITALQAKDCEDKIKKLQQRMATSVPGIILDPGTLTNTTEK